MNYGYIKVAAAQFITAVGDTKANADEIIKYVKKAVEEQVELIVFPELSITGYTCADLFSNRKLLDMAKEALGYIAEKTRGDDILICVGMPLEDHSRLFNCAVYIQNGKIVGAVPKTYIPNYGEFYEKRWFVSSDCRVADSIELCGQEVPFDENLILRGQGDYLIGTEICEDLWVDNPPSGMLTRAGATIIVNPSASNDTIAKREYRRNLVTMQSARCRCGYVYASCGSGESSTDLVFSGHNMIADNGRMVAETTDYMAFESMVTGLIDVERCVHDRRKYNSDAMYAAANEIKIKGPFNFGTLPERVDPYPFVPSGDDNLNARCQEILSLQARGLIQRLRAIHCEKVVVGISGGLDSTLALLVCCKAYDALGMSRSGINAITMPGFGTSSKTKNIADKLMQQLGVEYSEIDIKENCTRHLQDIGHPLDQYDITYENAQARERTQILFDYANKIGGIVIGTGDMSELALGWCTYNGDHMSNYAVNSGVPKTLVKYLVRSYALSAKEDLRQTLMEVFDLPISPELLPTDVNGAITQKTEESIGKYDLHDFFMYHYMRNGYSKDKIRALCQIAYPQVEQEEIDKTLDVFFYRFRTQQFKRSCLPDGVKIGTVAISPRGDLRLPSDMSALY